MFFLKYWVGVFVTDCLVSCFQKIGTVFSGCRTKKYACFLSASRCASSRGATFRPHASTVLSCTRSPMVFRTERSQVRYFSTASTSLNVNDHDHIRKRTPPNCGQHGSSLVVLATNQYLRVLIVSARLFEVLSERCLNNRILGKRFLHSLSLFFVRSRSSQASFMLLGLSKGGRFQVRWTTLQVFPLPAGPG